MTTFSLVSLDRAKLRPAVAAITVEFMLFYIFVVELLFPILNSVNNWTGERALPHKVDDAVMLGLLAPGLSWIFARHREKMGGKADVADPGTQ